MRARAASWAVAMLLVAGGLVLWRDYGLAVAMSDGAWLCLVR